MSDKNKKSELVKYIVVPADVDVDLEVVRCYNCGAPQTGGVGKTEHNTEAVSFADFFRNNILSDPFWGSKEGELDLIAKTALNIELRQALKKLDPDDSQKNVLTLGKSDWDIVMERLRKPTGTFQPTLLYQFWPFIEAIKEALDEDPRLKAISDVPPVEIVKDAPVATA